MSSSESEVDEDGAGPATLVDFVVISGLDQERDLSIDQYDDSAALDDSPLERSYQPHVLQHFPAERHWEAKFDPAAVAVLCFPRGLRFKLPADNRRVSLHPFTITKENGFRSYGVSLTVYEEVTNQRLIDALNVLEQMHHHQQECLLSPFSPRSPTLGRDKTDFTRSAAPRFQGQIGGGLQFTPIERLYAPKSIALLSQFPVVATLEQYLRQLYAVERSGRWSHSAGALLRNLLTSVPVPVEGWAVSFKCAEEIRLYRPGRQELPMCQFSFRRLFGLFTVETIVKLFTCVLLEQQMVLVSGDYELPILVSECLTALLYPFIWQNVYVPILPSNALHFLEAPVPYIMGIHSSMRHLEFGNVDCIIDIDNGTKTLPEDLPEFPFSATLIASLKALLRSPDMQPATVANSGHSESWMLPPLDAADDLPPFPNNIDSAQERMFSRKVRELFLSTFVEMFANMDSYIITPEENYQEDCDPDQEVFDKLSFFSDQPKEHLEFLVRFTQSQLFVSFMDAQGFGHGQMIGDVSLGLFKRLLSLANKAAPPQAGGLDAGHRLQQIFRRNSDGDVWASSPQPSPMAEHKSYRAQQAEPDCDDEAPPPDPEHRVLFDGLEDMGDLEITLNEYEALVRASEGSTVDALEALRLDEPSTSDSIPPPRCGGLLVPGSGGGGDDNANFSTPRRPTRSGSTRSTDGRRGQPGSGRRHTDGGSRPQSALSRRATDGCHSWENSTQSHFGDSLRRQTAVGPKPTPSKAAQQAQKLVTIGHGSSSASHDSYHLALLKECNSKVKACVLAALDGETATSLGYAGAASVDHIVFALCEALERVWRHGCRSTRGKSCLWVFLDQSSKICAAAGSLPVKNNVSAIDGMNLKTDVGRARAWVRLCIEQKVLKQELEIFLDTPLVMQRFFKGYAFLMQEEYREQLLFQLLSLTTVELLAFSPKYPEAEIDYTVTILTTKAFKGGSSAAASFTCAGSLLTSDPISCPNGSYFGSGQECTLSFKNLNLGALQSARLRHDGSSWTVEGVLVKNIFTGTEVWFACDDAASAAAGDGTIVLELYTEPGRGAGGPEAPTLGSDLDAAVQRAHDALCESVATTVNCIVRAYVVEGKAPSYDKRALLLLGGSRLNTRSEVELNADGVDSITEGGLCKTLLFVFSYGFRASSFLGADRHPWVLLAKYASTAAKRAEAEKAEKPKKGRRSSSSNVPLDPCSGRSSRGGVDGWSQNREQVLASDPNSLLISTIQRANRAKISKAVRFEFLICAGASHHVLHVWIRSLADYAVASGLYGPTSVFHNPSASESITEMMRILIDFPFDLLGRLLYVRYDEGSFWELQDAPPDGSMSETP